MFTKRIIPCLDIKDGRTVKGTNFLDLRDAGDPVELAIRYCEEQADELLFLDISATNENRKTILPLVNEIAKHINIPFTVGGGINTINDVEKLLNHGADKVSVNSAAVKDPSLINELAKNFGSQCVVVAIDIKIVDQQWKVVTHGGKKLTHLFAQSWAEEVMNRGAGEILLTSMEHDGMKKGFAIDITKEIASSVSIPVIASGGAGKMQDFADIFQQGFADAALAASIFHFGEINIQELKIFLNKKKVNVRL